MQNQILEQLREMAVGNEKYADFNGRIVNAEAEVLGVRVPVLRKFAQKLAKNIGEGEIRDLLSAKNQPFEYTLLCGFLITHAKIGGRQAISLALEYLRLANSWAHIDYFVEKKARFATEIWWNFALECLRKEREFEVRYGVISLMANFLDNSHVDEVFLALEKVKHDGYYVKMALAWFYATAAVDFFDETLQELDSGKINAWVVKKSYQKMRESRRFTAAQQAIIAKRRNLASK